MSQALSHSVPQVPRCQISTLPEQPSLPPTARIFSLSGEAAMSHGTRTAGTALPGEGGTRRGSSLPVQLVELGHAATCGLSVHVPKEREVGLKRVLGSCRREQADLCSHVLLPGSGQQNPVCRGHTPLQGDPVLPTGSLIHRAAGGCPRRTPALHGLL
uniref:Uncharacterized protein n=1 Tax=Anas platyrhynchos TaxID=8839 RepID=A0A8B9R3D3_ANAPL